VSLKIKNIKNKNNEKLKAIAINLADVLKTPVVHTTKTDFAYAKQSSSESPVGLQIRSTGELEHTQISFSIDE
jgi:hypothetical protein